MDFYNIKVVLVNTKHPGNIGSVARAMKTMGLSSLYLVNPSIFPSNEATAMASGADDILSNSTITQTLEQALEDSAFVVGASARVRGVSLPIKSPESSMTDVLKEFRRHKVALVFGREDRGLLNKELQLCHQQVCIPSIESYSSLNLGASVQVLAYELHKLFLQQTGQQLVPEPSEQTLATMGEAESFYVHLQQTLNNVGFFENSNMEKIMAKLRRLYGKARPDNIEINILRGMLTAIDNSITQK